MIKRIIFLIFILLSTLSVSKLQAMKSVKDTNGRYDSIHISLLTCSPHDEVYSLYGHSAIRYRDDVDGVDLAINYGVFSFKKPYFVLRFVFGLTDYEMGIQNFSDFCEEYSYYGSSVTQQELRLTPDEKEAIYEALQKNALPENVTYRYNYLYNNCTTKARDILIDNLSGRVVYNNKIDGSISFRDMIHSCNENHPWARFGNDLLMGVKADFNTDRSEQQFLPANLMRNFNHAQVIRDGKAVPLVEKTEVVVKGQHDVGDSGSKLCPTPMFCACMLLIVVLLVSLLEYKFKVSCWLFDAFLLLVSGLSGLILTAMIFSQHPTVSLNLQILMLNPLALYCVFYLIKNRRNIVRMKKMWTVCSVVILLALACSLIQTFAEGMEILALSLLIRTICNICVCKKTIDKDEK